LPDANPYQLRVQTVATLLRKTRLWAKGTEGLSPNMAHRRAALAETLGSEIPTAEGQGDGVLTFSPSVPHGTPNTHLGTVMMTRIVRVLIIDHHLLRCEAGLSWLQRLSSETGRQVMCAADFMGRPRCLLEAQRVQLYEEMPVPDGWHEAYARGEADTRRYQDYRKRCMVYNSRGKEIEHAYFSNGRS
jgi:hypothetical protein